MIFFSPLQGILAKGSKKQTKDNTQPFIYFPTNTCNPCVSKNALKYLMIKAIGVIIGLNMR